jgi:hypothetical protein
MHIRSCKPTFHLFPHKAYMRPLIYRLASAASLAAFLVSCSKEKLDVTPSTRVSTANANVAFTLTNYTTLPEPVLDVAGDEQTINRLTPNTTPATFRTPAILGQSTNSYGHFIYAYNPYVRGSAPDQYSDTQGQWERRYDQFDYLQSPFKLAKLVVSYNPSASVSDNSGAHTEMWAIDEQNRLWGHTNNYTYSGAHWYWTGSYATDVALYKSYESTYYLDVATATGGYKIYHYAGSFSAEVSPGFGAVSIAVDGQNRLWAVDNANKVYVNSNPLNGGTFVYMPGISAIKIASDGGTIAVLSPLYGRNGYQIIARSASDPINQNTWQLQVGEATHIAGSSTKGGYFISDALGQLSLLN